MIDYEPLDPSLPPVIDADTGARLIGFTTADDIIVTVGCDPAEGRCPHQCPPPVWKRAPADGATVYTPCLNPES
ncbi:hypothetical protein PG2022B_0982 [Bifidobacterium animalis subsp. animalis]|nr:hypothetical protein PG2022B_0982 [Bifidobacterium animalis subsp. animalis]